MCIRISIRIRIVSVYYDTYRKRSANALLTATATDTRRSIWLGKPL